MSSRQILVLSEASNQVTNLQVILEFIGKKSQLIDEKSLPRYYENPENILAIIISIKTYPFNLDTLLSRLQYDLPHVPIILLKDTEKQSSAEYCYDMVTLPYRQAELQQIMQRCELQQAPEPQVPAQIAMREMAELIVGNSEKIKELRDLVAQVANSDVNVLVLGESGTGKEVVAKCIHQWSRRHHHAFVPVNCGAIPSDLLESELFGHEKGAFTGALSARKGRFEMAAGGSIFLDEIGDMPLAMQVKLLRVIQERCFERVGSSTSMRIDVRIVAATHRNLEQAMKHGEFREDLYYRLNVFPIHMPTLRERVDDLPLLITDIVNRCGKEQGCSLTFTKAALNALGRYEWPGNIRELGNLIERLMVLYPNGTVDEANLPLNYRRSDPAQLSTHVSIDPSTFLSTKVDLKEYLMNTELVFIKQALEHCDGVIARAAEFLSIRRTTLVEKMRKYGLSREAVCPLGSDASRYNAS